MARANFGALLAGVLLVLPGCGSSDSAHPFSSTLDAAASRGGEGATSAGGSATGGTGGATGSAGTNAGGDAGAPAGGSGGTGAGGATESPDASSSGGAGDAGLGAGGSGSGGGDGGGAGGSGPTTCSTDLDCAGFGVDVCQRPACLANGTCAAFWASDGAPCNDGDACTQTDTCTAHQCIGGNPVVCRPSDQCHEAGVCEASGQCTDPPLADGTACSDGLGCTAFDTCTAGVCGGTPITCNDGVACTTDACSETAGGCTADPTGCGCTHDADCDDGNACNGAETCDLGADTCRTGTAVDCSPLTDDCNTGTCNSTTGACTATPRADGTTCDDGNACTQTDTCQAGACKGVNPVVCFAADSCHAAGTCNIGTGACTTPPLADGAACTDGNPCTKTDTCQGGACTGQSPVVCIATDACHSAGLCNPLDGLCTAPSKPDGAACSDGNACTLADTCQAGVCLGASPVVCGAQDSCHTAGACDPGTGQCSNPPSANGAACDDGNACTQTDTCQAGVCVGASPVTCSAQDVCHTAGTCDPASGQCSNPVRADGSACTDGNPCTQTDTCLAGSCKGSNPVVCTAQDQCHTAGTCNPLDGLCTSPTKPSGTACDDGNACTQTDTCQAGTCAGQNPVTCSAADQCHLAGTCNPASGTCSSPAKPDGATCNDGLSCTDSDACTGGVCGGTARICNDGIPCTVDSCSEAAGGCTVNKSACGCAKDADCDDGNACNGVETCLATLTCKPGTPVDCSSLTNACNTGTCNTATGACTALPNANGTACNDGNACTQSDTCQSGACTGTNPVACTALDQCHTAGACNPGSGTCSNPQKADSAACNDGNACTQTDTCQSGACKGSNAVVCTAQDQCHTTGACNPNNGTCSNPTKGNGTSCDDSNACTQTDTCQSGACTGSNAVVCTALDQCHLAGACNPGTGKCGNPPKPDATPCTDQDACTQTDTCQSGVCKGSNPVVCTAQDQCHLPGACSSSTGACSNPPRGNGTGCDDGNGCTQTDTCVAGKCTGSNPITCIAQDQCHLAGSCVSATGLCTNPSKSNGASCNDGLGCTPTDSCQAGVCGGTDVCSVTVTPTVLSLLPSDTFTFAAVVSGTANQAVTWSVVEGMPAGGVVDSSGGYVAPSALGTYHVTATSVADPTQSATATITVTKTPVAVSICPQTTTLLTDDTMVYTAMVSGTSNQAVTWSVSGPSGGSIGPSGLFTPGSAGTYTITAVSQAEPGKQATATATVVVQTLPSVSGAVSYAGAKQGRIYVLLQPFGGGATTMLVPGKYRIRDAQLPFQPVMVLAYRDTLGTGVYVSGVDPAGTATFTWSGTDPGNVNITLVDPTPPALVAPPGVNVAIDSGLAMVSAQQITDAGGSELPDHYRVYAGLDAGVGPGSSVMTREYPAGGIGVAVLAPLTNGTPYWFAVAGVRGGVVGPTRVVGPFTVNPAASGSGVSGTVDFTGLTPTGPLYVLALPNQGPPRIARYVPGSGATSQAFTLQGVPDGVYELVALFDQADDGVISSTDPGNFHANSAPLFAVQGGPVTGLTALITSADALANVTTKHTTDGVSDTYGLTFHVGPNQKLVAKVALTSGPGLSAPTDLPTRDQKGGTGEYRWEPPSGPALPVIGGVYTFDVTYDDGVTCSLSTTVSAVLSGTPTVVSPTTTAGTKPKFVWLAPTPAPAAFTYSLDIRQQGSSSSPFWRYAMPSTQTSVDYDVDSSASSSTLTSGASYFWGISVLDPAGNEARYNAAFTVP